MPFQQINQLVNSKKNVAHHYDIDENLYKLFLDKDMQYSCAYFHNPNISLDEAILRFENAYESYNNLHDFAVSKKRDANNYRKVYSQLFTEARRKYI